LKGETLVQAKKFKEAEAFYQEYLALNGPKEDSVVRSLAFVYEALGETGKAKALYGELLNACMGCGRRADADLRRRFADTCFSLGEYNAKTLELYLELAGTDPFNKADYYEKVSTIYHAMGNEKESFRFKGFSEKERRKGHEEA
jgi:tetratricopeptide (TPR) repeat protein